MEQQKKKRVNFKDVLLRCTENLTFRKHQQDSRIYPEVSLFILRMFEIYREMVYLLLSTNIAITFTGNDCSEMASFTFLFRVVVNRTIC